MTTFDFNIRSKRMFRELEEGEAYLTTEELSVEEDSFLGEVFKTGTRNAASSYFAVTDEETIDNEEILLLFKNKTDSDQNETVILRLFAGRVFLYTILDSGSRDDVGSVTEVTDDYLKKGLYLLSERTDLTPEKLVLHPSLKDIKDLNISRMLLGPLSHN